MIPLLNIFAGNEHDKYINYFPIISEYSKIGVLKLILFIFLFLYVMKFLINRYLIVIQHKFSNEFYAKLAKRFFRHYLNKSYIFHTQNNSSLLIRNVNSNYF